MITVTTLQGFLIFVWLMIAVAMILTGFAIGWICARVHYGPERQPRRPRRRHQLNQLRRDLDQFGGQR